jgi:hypothetical protein
VIDPNPLPDNYIGSITEEAYDCLSGESNRRYRFLQGVRDVVLGSSGNDFTVQVYQPVVQDISIDALQYIIVLFVNEQSEGSSGYRTSFKSALTDIPQGNPHTFQLSELTAHSSSPPFNFRMMNEMDQYKVEVRVHVKATGAQYNNWTMHSNPYQIDANSLVPINCSGSFGPCVDGYKTYTVTTDAWHGGVGCPYSTGTRIQEGCAEVFGPTPVNGVVYNTPVILKTVNAIRSGDVDKYTAISTLFVQNYQNSTNHYVYYYRSPAYGINTITYIKDPANSAILDFYGSKMGYAFVFEKDADGYVRIKIAGTNDYMFMDDISFVHGDYGRTGYTVGIEFKPIQHALIQKYQFTLTPTGNGNGFYITNGARYIVTFVVGDGSFNRDRQMNWAFATKSTPLELVQEVM